ncbi:MAG: hypothetical protein AAGL89_07140 [Pseudomonadota bacterium]
MLERTLAQLDVGHVPDHIAGQIGRLGYIQWLGALKGEAGYFKEATRDYELAQPFIRTSPAVAVFCDLVIESLASLFSALELKLPTAARRGGAKARRDAL